MERKILSLEDHIKYLYDELEAKESEIDDLKNDLTDAKDKCKRISAAYDSVKEDMDNFKTISGDQKVKIMCLRKHRN